ncbi:MAG: hypothetical protein K0Q59_698 [Paenibacillus sp.]|nr:hypothetical protein [Paenibacillus sp.]
MFVFMVCFIAMFLLGMLLVPFVGLRLSRGGPFVKNDWRITVVFSSSLALVMASIAAIWVK